MKCLGNLILLACAVLLSLVACSSTPKTQVPQVQPVAATAGLDSAIVSKVPEKKVYPQNLDIAHESFIRAQEMELRGERELSAVFMQRAYEADPGNRFLAFSMAKLLFANGNDSLALSLAREAYGLDGRVGAEELALLARLYVREGRADSARKYFVAALDSSRYQDMNLIYDYSLFLEVVRDEEELVRIYDLLLPQVNFMQSLFQRQVKLLLDLKRDSAVVDLFGRAHEATGDIALLEKMVQGLILLKRVNEAKAIADTVTCSDSECENIVLMTFSALGEKDRKLSFEFIKKKYYEDNMKTPLMTYHLGNMEYAANARDSARVHFLSVLKTPSSVKPEYAAQSARALAGIAFVEDRKSEAVRYAEMADSIMSGGDKEFLAMSYAFAGLYEKAYGILDTLVKVWEEWHPMEGVADSATVEVMMKKARLKYSQVQGTYASVLVAEAREIEMDGKASAQKQSRAIECRQKAHGLWEKMIKDDSTNLSIKSSMARNLERMGRYDESFRLFEELLFEELRPLAPGSGLDYADLLNYYGYTLIDANRTQEEVQKGYELVLDALELETDPHAREAYLDSKAWGLFRMGKFEEALETMKLIKGESFQDDYVYWEHMGAIQSTLGMKADALSSYRKLLKLRPNHKAAKEYLGKKK